MTNNSESKPRRAVLWDMDGVLFDTLELHLKSWQQTLEPLGLSMEMRDLKKWFGMNNFETLSQLLGREPEQETLDKIGKKKEAHFRELAGASSQPMPGVRDWLNRFQANQIPQAIVSSAPMENITVQVRQAGIEAYFVSIISAAKLPSKPDPAGFLQAAKELDVRPENCLVFEDSLAGVEAAKRAGMKCIAVTTTHASEKLHQADQVIERLNQLPVEMVEKLLGVELGR